MSKNNPQLDGPVVEGEVGIASLVPFGLDTRKPRHFLSLGRFCWENKDNLSYAWRIFCGGQASYINSLSNMVLRRRGHLASSSSKHV